MTQMPKTFTQTKTMKKRYYARVPNSRFCHEDGHETYFLHGFADIEILEHQEEINKILGKNPNIYLPTKAPESLPEVPQNALSEAELSAAEAALRGVPGRIAQEMGKPDANAGVPSDPNASTVDQDLQAAVFKHAPKIIGPGAGTVKPIPAIEATAPGAASSVSGR